MSSLLLSVYLAALLLGLAYWLLIGYWLRQWRKLPVFDAPPSFSEKTVVTVLVPARNEEDQIEACLRSIFAQTYPAAYYEVIVIDDHSDDNTPAIVAAMEYPNLRLIRLKKYLPAGTTAQSFKKKALEVGVAEAAGELILTTDADCRVPAGWISLVVGYYQRYRPAFIAGPVNFYGETNDLERFQSLDFMGTMVLTGAGIQSGWMHLANGANMAYPKSVFEAVGGYRDADQLASGDDLMLLHKIAARFPGKIAFLKSPAATVHTQAKPDWRSFLQQRLRWATKTGNYKEWQVTAVLGLVFVFCWAILVSPLLLFIFGGPAFGIFLILLFCKITADYRLLSTAVHFFGRPGLMGSFLISQVLHIVYVALIGLLGSIVREY